MTSLSDTLTVGLVLVLLFGAVALYLYTRIQQAEQKLNLLESILLDLKMSTEIHSYSELPAMDEPKGVQATESTPETYTPFEDEQEVTPSDSLETPSESTLVSTDNLDQDVEQYKSVVAEAIKDDNVDTSEQKSSSVNYDSMTLKELQALAKTRGIVGANTMKKAPIIEALKTSDKIQTSSLDNGFTSMTNSFLETSSTFPANESS